MAALTVYTTKLAGVQPVYVAAGAGGDTFVHPMTPVILHVKNGGAGAITVTVNSLKLSSYGTDVDAVVAIPAAEERMIGAFPAQRFRAAATGNVSISYTGVTSVTVCAIAVDPDGI